MILRACANCALVEQKKLTDTHFFIGKGLECFPSIAAKLKIICHERKPCTVPDNAIHFARTLHKAIFLGQWPASTPSASRIIQLAIDNKNLLFP